MAFYGADGIRKTATFLQKRMAFYGADGIRKTATFQLFWVYERLQLFNSFGCGHFLTFLCLFENILCVVNF